MGESYQLHCKNKMFSKIIKILSSKTLMMIYYAFFHSLVSYGIIAWGGAYSNCLNQVQAIQKKILRIINRNRFETQQCPLTVRQLFKLEAISFHYANLRHKYITSSSNTRNKSIQ